MHAQATPSTPATIPAEAALVLIGLTLELSHDAESAATTIRGVLAQVALPPS